MGHREILKRRLNVEVPLRLGYAECVQMSAYGETEGVKTLRRCSNCKHHHNKLSSKTCTECLSTRNLCNFADTEEHLQQPDYLKRRFGSSICETCVHRHGYDPKYPYHHGIETCVTCFGQFYEKDVEADEL